MKNLVCNIFLLLFILLRVHDIHAQEKAKYGFDLREYLKTTAPYDMVPLLVEGSTPQLDEVISKYQGNKRLQLGMLYSIDVPAQFVPAFSMEKEIIAIEFSRAPGHSLSDTMLINTNVDSIFKNYAPLRSNYTGKGVLMGVIDSGIELDHPDFQDSSGNTRVLYIWDQKVAHQPARKANNYNYGVEWTATDIDAGICTHEDDANEFGHGSNVTGAAASNGLAAGNLKGVAPEIGIITVATDFYKANWLQTVVEAVDYIYSKADSLGMPCVINASVGTYLGSHDGKDIAARMIDTLIKQKSARAFVCAAGNAGTIPFHLQQKPQNDTAFTWFECNPAQWSGLGGLYFELWADTNDFNQVRFSIGADKSLNGSFNFRGRTAFDSIQSRLNVIYDDSIVNPQGLRIASIKTYAEMSQGRYKLEVAIINPDSSDYLYRLETTGVGKLDLWSSYDLFRHGQMVNSNLPSAASFPAIAYYQNPDTIQSIVSSFTCLPSAITVGNYVNRSTFTDVSNTYRTINVTPGQISVNSSLGPSRIGIQKPDISSAGGNIFAAGHLATIQSAIASNPSKVSQDSMHFRNGGTSMASPTVAGMVALYLQMCPQVTYDQIKQDIITSAKSDQFTSQLPNNKWGFGKADGFQFLKTRVFTPSLVAPTEACEGDTVLITGLNTAFQYRWENNLVATAYAINQTDTIFAIASDSIGCNSPTDTVSVVFHPLPAKPIINQAGNQLSITEIGQYQWYYYNSAIASATDSILNVFSNGDYHCIYTNASNCSISSDTLSVIVTGLEKLTTPSLSIHPNPSEGTFQMQFEGVESINSLEVYNLAGKLVWNKLNVPAGQLYRLDLSHLNKGIYFLRVNSSRATNNYKIVIQ